MFVNKLAARIGLSVTFFLGGCAAIDKANAPLLSGSPATSALIVVKSEAFIVNKSEAVIQGLFDLKTSQQIESGVLLSPDGSVRVEGRAVAGLIIFSNVAPGEYNLAIVQTSSRSGTTTWQHNYYIPPEHASNFVISVTAGEAKFLGIVTIEDVRSTSERGVIFALNPSKKAEASAWEKFTQLYPGSAWASEVQKLKAELKR